MNSTSLKLKVFVAASVIMGMSMTAGAQVVYGLKNANHFHTSKSGPIFIQVESFRSEHLAQKLKARLAKHTHYPVEIQVVQHYYTVRIGPLPSAAAVRSFNEQSTSSTAKTTTAAIQKPSAHKISTTKHSHLKHTKIEPGNAQQNPPPSSIAPVPSTSPMPPMSFIPPNQWYVGVDLGFMSSSFSKVMTVDNGSGFPPPANVDEFSLSRISPIMLAAQVGHRWNRERQWLPSYALAVRYQHVFSRNIHGTVTQFSLPQFRNYTYNWGVEADAVSAYSKIDLVQFGRFMPYFDVGVGASFNHSLRYSERALPNVTPRLSPKFASRTSSEFTYNVGAGLDYRVNPNIIVSAGYDFQSFGNVTSGFGTGPDWRNTKLHLGKYNTNTGLIGISYLFDNSVPMSPAVYK